MRSLRSSTLLLAASLISFAAHADDKPARKADDKAAKAADKTGFKGITPYTEKLLKGHKLIAARDFVGAIDSYRAAITEDDKNPQAHYFLGVAQLLKGDLVEAEATWQNALRNAGADAVIATKTRFALADLRERQRKLDDSKDAWKDYGKYAADHPKVTAYPNTPVERQKTIDRWQDLDKKYGEVKARIQAREKEIKDKRDAAAAKDAADEEKRGGVKKKLGHAISSRPHAPGSAVPAGRAGPIDRRRCDRLPGSRAPTDTTNGVGARCENHARRRSRATRSRGRLAPRAGDCDHEPSPTDSRHSRRTGRGPLSGRRTVAGARTSDPLGRLPRSW